MVNKQYIIDHSPVWMEHSLPHPSTREWREQQAISLANHLCNNWDQTHPVQIEWSCLVCKHPQSYTLWLSVRYFIPRCELCGSHNYPSDTFYYTPK